MSIPLEAPFNIISIYQRFAQPRLISVSVYERIFFFFLNIFEICLLTVMEELLCSWFDDEILLIP